MCATPSRSAWGEEVALIDDDASAEPHGAPEWHKIAPPAGEFRWVCARFLSREPVADGPSDAARGAGRAGSDRPRTKRTARHADDNPREDDELPRRSTDDEPDVEADEGSRELALLEAALARAVAGEPSEWDLDRLRDQAEEVRDAAKSDDVRQAARRFAKKVDRFRKLHRRAAELAPAGEELAADDSPERDPPADSTDDDRRFDGAGRLARVVSRRVGDPQFALIDDDGEVCGYVSAAPGVNLRKYVGQRVGLLGQRGYLPGLAAEHVTARQVTPLDATARR
jgi:hypothetical protein